MRPGDLSGVFLGDCNTLALVFAEYGVEQLSLYRFSYSIVHLHFVLGAPLVLLAQNLQTMVGPKQEEDR